MINRFRSGAALIAATALLTGCGSSSSSSRSSGGTLPGSTAGFPGGTVEANYLADDGKAFSNAGQVVNVPLRMFWNRSNGQAIGVFATNPYVVGQNAVVLYTAWYDGTVWHAPVEIHGQNEDADALPGVPMVLWLNTTGNANTNALGRNGDAIIAYMRSDADPAVAGDADDNVRLYATYFDVSAANAAATGTLQGGFDTLARVVDYDNSIAAVNTNFAGIANDNDPDVFGIAFASDSLAGSHELSGGNLVDSGDPTTFVHLLYCKDPTEGDPAAATNKVGLRWWAVNFDLTQSGNTLPVGTATSVLPVPATLDTAAVTENVSSTVTVHNGHVFTSVSGVVQAPGGNDTALIAYALGTGATTVTGELNSARQDDSNDVASRPAAAHVYGADHGLASTMFFFEEEGFDDTGDGVGVNRSANRDIMLGELRVSAGATTAAGPIEVDGFRGLIDTTDADATGGADGAVVRAGTTSNSSGAVALGTLQTRINRTGTLIFALWLQDNSDVTDLDPTTNQITALIPNVIPFATVVQTRNDAADLRALAASVPAAFAIKSPAFESTDHLGPGAAQDQGPVEGLRFQEGLAGGRATSQANFVGALNSVPADRGSTFQGNPLRVSWLYTQYNDLSGLDTDNVVLYLNGVTVTPGVLATDPPVMALTNATTTAARVDEVDEDWFAGFSLQSGDYLAVDAGDTSATAGAGRVLVFFPSNGQNEIEQVVGSFDEQRLYVSEQTSAGTAGTKNQVSTDPATSFQPHAAQHIELQGAMIVPVNANTVTAPNHVGERIHLYWIEERDVPGSSFSNGRRLATRSYEQVAAVASGSRFIPALPTGPGTGAPTHIDLSSSGDVVTSFFGGAVRGGRNGETVGVYFDEDAHLYYTETTGDATGYPTDLSGPNPALVDNDSNFVYDLDTFNVLFPPVGDNLSRSQVWFQRFDSVNVGPGTGGPGIARLFVRSHN